METLIPLVATLFFYAVLPLTVGYAWIFGYHWYQYGTKQGHASLALLIFLGGAIICLGVMFLSLQYVN